MVSCFSGKNTAPFMKIASLQVNNCKIIGLFQVIRACFRDGVKTYRGGRSVFCWVEGGMEDKFHPIFGGEGLRLWSLNLDNNSYSILPPDTLARNFNIIIIIPLLRKSLFDSQWANNDMI